MFLDWGSDWQASVQESGLKAEASQTKKVWDAFAEGKGAKANPRARPGAK